MANEKRLIDANVLIQKLQEAVMHKGMGAAIAGVLIRYIEKLPTVDAVEVVHGRWEKHGKHDWRCSVCKVGVPYSYTGNHYCHNCGAKMDNRKDNLEWKYTPKATEIDFDYEAED